MSSAQDFRSLIPQPPGVKISRPTARAHARARLKDGRARQLFDHWSRLYAEPYHGLTVDGRVLPDLYKRRSERAPTASMVDAARQLRSLLSQERQQLACFPIDAPKWRRWQNTEIYAETGGLRLEEANDAIRSAVLTLMRPAQ